MAELEPPDVPRAVGVKVTEIVQLVPASMPRPQVFISANSPALAPVIAICPTLRREVPVLLTVTFCAGLVVFKPWETNVRDVGLTANPAAGGKLRDLCETYSSSTEPIACYVIVLKNARSACWSRFWHD